MLLVGPGERLGDMPALLADGRAERPVEQISHVGENLHRHAARSGKAGEVVGCAVEYTRRTIGECGEGVAQQFAFLIHMRSL